MMDLSAGYFVLLQSNKLKRSIYTPAHAHTVYCVSPPADVMSVRVGALERLERSGVPQAWSWASVQNTAS